MLDQARAAANLAKLSFPPTELKRLARDWSSRQLAQAVQQIASDAGRLEVSDELGDDAFDRMFVSFHFSVYPHIYRALANRSPTRTVCSLIGEQTFEHQAALRHLAKAFGFDIRFVQSGLSMVRSLRSAIADGMPGIILLDIPWSRQKEQELDTRYPAFGGEFLGLSTVQRLIRTIDPRFEAAYAFREGSAVRLVRKPLDQIADAFADLGQMIGRDPSDYERLHHFHKFFRFSGACRLAVTFRVRDQRYAIHADTMKAWKLPSDPRLDAVEDSGDGIVAEEKLLDPLRKATSEEIDAVLCL